MEALNKAEQGKYPSHFFNKRCQGLIFCGINVPRDLNTLNYVP